MNPLSFPTTMSPTWTKTLLMEFDNIMRRGSNMIVVIPRMLDIVPMDLPAIDHYIDWIDHVVSTYLPSCRQYFSQYESAILIKALQRTLWTMYVKYRGASSEQVKSWIDKFECIITTIIRSRPPEEAAWLLADKQSWMYVFNIQVDDDMLNTQQTLHEGHCGRITQIIERATMDIAQASQPRYRPLLNAIDTFVRTHKVVELDSELLPSPRWILLDKLIFVKAIGMYVDMAKVKDKYDVLATICLWLRVLTPCGEDGFCRDFVEDALLDTSSRLYQIERLFIMNAHVPLSSHECKAALLDLLQKILEKIPTLEVIVEIPEKVPGHTPGSLLNFHVLPTHTYVCDNPCA